MALLQLIGLATTIGLYISFIITYIRHFHFCYLLFRGFPKRGLGKHESLLSRVGYARLGPAYRESYFGYEGFGVMIDEKVVMLKPDHYLRVYGIVRPWSLCMLLYKHDTIKTVIVVDEIRYANKVMAFFERTFTCVLIIIYGGVILWQTCLKFLIFSLAS